MTEVKILLPPSDWESLEVEDLPVIGEILTLPDGRRGTVTAHAVDADTWIGITHLYRLAAIG